MESSLGAAVCLICFELTEKNIHVPADVPAIFSSCNKYLHSTLNLKDMKLSNENQLPLCKNCFDSALELTNLSQQLATIEKHISDFTVTFSMAVFHRRSQVYKLRQIHNNSDSFQNSSIIEFNVACLPPNLFSTKTEDQNINHSQNNDFVINSLHTTTNMANVKLESSHLRFENVIVNRQSLIANDSKQTQFNQENLESYCTQPTIEHNNRNLVSVSRITDVFVPDGNGSKNCTNRKNGIQLSKSDLLKSVRMPEIQLERIKIEGIEVGASAENSCPTKSESRTDVTMLTNENFSEASYAPNSSESEKFESLHRRRHAGEKTYKCSYCPQKFVSRPNQKIHERMHTGSNPFKCSYCDKSYHARPTLLIHERVHTGEKPYECSFCDKKFANFGGMKKHESTHTGEKPYKCSFCEKGFVNFTSLKVHKMTHTGERPFTCSFCKKRFSTMTAVKQHERTHTGEKPFQCSFCQKGFSTMGVLNIHKRVHTGEKPYKCLYCEKWFRHTKGKNSHEKTHRKNRPSLMCTICNLNCSSSAQLKHHEKIHSTPPIHYKCSFCEITFNRNEDRNIHEKTHNSRKDQIVNENLQTFIVGI